MKYHWIEWDLWDGRTRRYAILEKKIIFEKNKKNGTVLVFYADKTMLESLQNGINRWNLKRGVYDKDELWKPEVKILDEITHRFKIFEIIGTNGEMVSFGHSILELGFSMKLPK
jgi:hypothetical protein